MAGVQEQGGSYRISFPYHGMQRAPNLGDACEHIAKSKSAQVGVS
jgi:hypothetical protein